jgi:hypothetical protein
MNSLYPRRLGSWTGYFCVLPELYIIVCSLQFQQQIHCVIPQKNGNEPLIMFSNGAVCPLSTAVGTRKEGNNTSLLNGDEIIEDCHLVTDEICTFVAVLCRSSSVGSASNLNDKTNE